MPSRYLRLRNWNTLSKIVGVNLIILLVSSLAIIFHVIPLYERSIQEGHKTYTSNLVDMATAVLSHYHSLALRNEMTLAEAQESAITSIRVMANRNDYIWVHDLNLVMVVHPYAPHLERKSLAEFRDPAGKRIFVEMNRIVKANGSGFLEYLWPKPTHVEPQPKISCIKLFEPWGWVVGSGIYYNDKKQETIYIRRQVVALSGTLFAAIILFSVYAARRIKQPLEQALQITSQITRTHLPDIKGVKTSDETRQLLHAIEMMVTELKDAKDEAERANRAKSDFLARMSHEIRTPMNAVVGMTELAMEGAASLEQKEYLEGVRSSAEHLTALINDILDFSKIEADRLTLEKIPFSLRDTLAATGQSLAFRARQKGLSFEVNVPPDLPDRLLGDPVRLRQIITNLAGNAIKFTSRGGITITAAEVAREAGEVLVAMYVRDTGIGIPREARERIFDPFVQADDSTARKFGGTGLGLAIVRQLVEMMGGGVSVASEPGLGSEFRFTARFRLTDEQASTREECLDERPAVAAQGTGRRAHSVLVAEDVELNQLIVARFLEKMGHRATVVTNGREAVDAWCGGGFDLVLMDVQMPEMDGLAATRAIREQERSIGGRIPIIAMTAHVMHQDVALCLEAGMDDHLDKPLRRVDLEKALEKVI